MNGKPNEQASINIFEQINAICREFRKTLRAGQNPQIEDWLKRVGGDAKSTLFSNLLEIEVNLRLRKGQSPASDEYLKRFPQFASQIRQAFDESTMGSLDQAVHSTPADSAGEAAITRTFEIPAANRLGDYELVRELGRGGFGVVYEAKHFKRGNRVALKTLPTGVDGQEINADRLHKFRREFRSLSEINHPNLVGMQTLEVDGSQWFFTMDLIEGEDFLSYVRPNDQLDDARLQASVKQLARGIISLHERSIVHRDLKPSNVMVEPDGRVVILDFGLVAVLQKNTDVTVSRSGMFAGTPKYAAPEQMFGERCEASDWYALGAMLYEGLTGQAPFRGSQMELLQQKQNEDPPSLMGRDDLPGDLAELADHLLKRDPNQRPNAMEIASILTLDVESTKLGTQGSVDESDADFDSVVDTDQVLIGREEQLAQLEAAKQDLLKNREPVVVWITGKSGEGKSSLADYFLRPIRLGNKMLVLSGRCYDRESVPFKAIDCWNPAFSGATQRFFFAKDPEVTDAKVSTKTIDAGSFLQVRTSAQAVTADKSVENSPLVLTPYYAWNNRGVSSMNVWFPKDPDLAVFDPHLLPQESAFSKITASHTFADDTVSAIGDGKEPRYSNGKKVPRWTSRPQKNKQQWVEARFHATKSLRSIGVYWMQDRFDVQFPAEWSLEVEQNGQWKPFELYTTDRYDTRANRYNVVHPAAPIRCDAIRVRMTPKEDACVGILEMMAEFEE